MKVSGKLEPLSCHVLYVQMHVNETKFEGNSFLEYYHMTCIGKKNIQAKEVYSPFLR